MTESFPDEHRRLANEFRVIVTTSAPDEVESRIDAWYSALPEQHKDDGFTLYAIYSARPKVTLNVGVDMSSGKHIGDNVGGDKVGGDKVGGDQVGGDKSGRDKNSIGAFYLLVFAFIALVVGLTYLAYVGAVGADADPPNIPVPELPAHGTP